MFYTVLPSRRRLGTMGDFLFMRGGLYHYCPVWRKHRIQGGVLRSLGGIMRLPPHRASHTPTSRPPKYPLLMRKSRGYFCAKVGGTLVIPTPHLSTSHPPYGICMPLRLRNTAKLAAPHAPVAASCDPPASRRISPRLIALTVYWLCPFISSFHDLRLLCGNELHAAFLRRLLL